MTDAATEKVTLRLTPETLRRAEALKKAIAKEPGSLGKVTQSMVLKMALAEGLALLEKRHR